MMTVSIGLLPDRQMAALKYGRPSRPYSLRGLKSPTAETMEDLRAVMARASGGS